MDRSNCTPYVSRVFFFVDRATGYNGIGAYRTMSRYR